MHGVLRAEVAGAIKIDRTAVRPTNKCSAPLLADIAIKLWPENAAACLAAEIGCSPRAVEFYFSGDRKFSGEAVAVIIAEILRRHMQRG